MQSDCNVVDFARFCKLSAFGLQPQAAIKFYPQLKHDAFRHESLFYENRNALEPETADAHTPRRLDAFKGTHGILTEDSVPSALVLERGEFTLKACPLPPRVFLKIRGQSRVRMSGKGDMRAVAEVRDAGQSLCLPLSMEEVTVGPQGAQGVCVSNQ